MPLLLLSLVRCNLSSKDCSYRGDSVVFHAAIVLRRRTISYPIRNGSSGLGQEASFFVWVVEVLFVLQFRTHLILCYHRRVR